LIELLLAHQGSAEASSAMVEPVGVYRNSLGCSSSALMQTLKKRGGGYL